MPNYLIRLDREPLWVFNGLGEDGSEARRVFFFKTFRCSTSILAGHNSKTDKAGTLIRSPAASNVNPTPLPRVDDANDKEIHKHTHTHTHIHARSHTKTSESASKYWERRGEGCVEGPFVDKSWEILVIVTVKKRYRSADLLFLLDINGGGVPFLADDKKPAVNNRKTVPRPTERPEPANMSADQNGSINIHLRIESGRASERGIR